MNQDRLQLNSILKNSIKPWTGYQKQGRLQTWSELSSECQGFMKLKKNTCPTGRGSLVIFVDNPPHHIPSKYSYEHHIVIKCHKHVINQQMSPKIHIPFVAFLIARATLNYDEAPATSWEHRTVVRAKTEALLIR